MLTNELVRYQVNGETVRPKYIFQRCSERYIHDAKNLIELIQNSIGKSQKEIDLALTSYEGERTDFQIIRGLFKLLLEKAEFTPLHPIDYVDFRKTVFTKVQQHYPVLTHKDLIHQKGRQEVLDDIARDLNISSGEIMERLYGDLPENQILKSWEIPFDEAALIKRYNLALAQGLLYRARQMRIHLKSDFRLVFQYIKLAGLMHQISSIESGGYEIVINGPASLLTLTQRYGVRMATFLPGLILANDWEMSAEIKTSQGMKQFHLNDRCGLTSHYHTLSPFDSAIEKNFYEKFARKKRSWSIEREGSLIDLGETVFIPDFTFHHEDGRTVYMEIVGYWTPEYLKKKIEKLNLFQEDNLILAVNSQLNCGRGDFKGKVIFYRTGIKLNDVMAMLGE